MPETPQIDLGHLQQDSGVAALVRNALRIIPSLKIPPTWLFDVPDSDQLAPARAPREIEVVSHCWNYAHLLGYQLSSLVLSPPRDTRVRMTVCYCSDDRGTAELLEFFGGQEVENVTWNWIALPREALLRRSVGRNLAAKATTADWVWFTDCDVVFAQGCFDGLAAGVEGRRDGLVYPREERTTDMLAADDPVLAAGRSELALREVNFDTFSVKRPRQATGPLQITRGELARAGGYCGMIQSYQTTTDRWRKTYEDRVFRWLLGTPGTPLDVPGVYRIRHVEKGRYRGGPFSRLRSWIRRTRDRGESTR